MNRSTAFAASLAAAALAAALAPHSASAQDAIAKFYAGKSMDMIIGAAPGGGFDIYARTIVRHMPNHIPGKPNMIPKNMPGAGTNKATGFIYGVAPKDGTVIGAVFPGAIMDPLLGDKSQVQHESTKLIYLGSANNEVAITVIRADAPAKTFQDLFTTGMISAASQSGGSSRDFPAALNNVLGTKIQLVSGYPGTKEMTLAIERLEVQGTGGYLWSSLQTQNPDWLPSAGKMRILVQEAIKGNAELNKMGVPLAMDFAKTEEDKQVLELIYGQLVFGRPYILPPGTPEDRVTALRRAFDATFKDKEFLADAAKARLTIDPVSGEEVQALVAKIYSAPERIVERAKEAMIYKK
jgi:tripartite-type tricarboxylate transporter receptor subunit TctC